MINKNSDIKFIVIQVILTICIAFIPIYFYLNASYENQSIKDKLALKNYANLVMNKIEDFKNENTTVFYYPRSNIFTSAIFDNNDNVIFSLLSHESLDFDTEFFEDKNQICYKKYINDNIFDAKYMIVCKNINNSEVIFNAIILLITVVSLIFLSSFVTIKQSIEPYKKLNIYLDNFLKDAMHELKTPIGVARFNIDMLQMKLNEDKHILRVKSALKNMTVIYEDLEFYISQNIVKHEKQDINLSLFLEKRLEFFYDLSTAKHINIEKSIQNDIWIRFNDIELCRIIDNNLSNALKYSKKDSLIRVFLKKDNDTTTLTFEDKGVGIKDITKIFERYYRGDKISGGFGIGLSIVKKICEDNNIAISVSSELGKGSTFSYIFYT